MSKTKLELDGLKALGFFVTAFLFIIGTVWFSSWLNKKTGVSDTQPALSSIKPPVCPADSLSYNSFIENDGKVAKLIDGRKSMFASNGRFINSQKVVTKNETKESKVACGYLLVRAGSDLYGALQRWENAYINPNNFGGHINIENQIGLGDGGEFSEYIFPLNEIRYWKTKADRWRGGLSNADWASLLNVSEEVTFWIALNTEERSGFIDEISIAYKCWNPLTGEENKECELKVEDKGDVESDSLLE